MMLMGGQASVTNTSHNLDSRLLCSSQSDTLMKAGRELSEDLYKTTTELRRLAEKQELETSLTQVAPRQQQAQCDLKMCDQETTWDACWSGFRSSGHLSGCASAAWMALKMFKLCTGIQYIYI